MALAGAIDAIGPMQAGIEPLRRIGRAFLGGEHVAELVIKGAGVLFAVEIAALPAPIGPSAGETIEHFLGADFAPGAFFGRKRAEDGFVRGRAPEPGGNGLFLDALQSHGDARFTKIFLRQDIGGDLAPGGGNLDALETEYDRAVGVSDLAHCLPEIQPLIGVLTRFCVAALDLHSFPLFSSMLAHRRTRENPPTGFYSPVFDDAVLPFRGSMPRGSSSIFMGFLLREPAFAPVLGIPQPQDSIYYTVISSSIDSVRANS